MPVETRKRAMVRTPTLKKIWALLSAKLFQVSVQHLNDHYDNMHVKHKIIIYEPMHLSNYEPTHLAY